MSKANQAAVKLETFMVGDVPIVVKEWMGQRVVTTRDIDQIHNKNSRRALQNFKCNIDKFVEKQDYFKLSSTEIQSLEPRANGYNYPHGSYVFTKSGYLILVKSLNDDKAWEIQRQLVNAYFTLEKMVADKANEVVDVPAVAEEKVLPAVKNPRKKKEINSLPVPATSDNSNAIAELIDLFKQSIAYQHAQLEVESKRNDDFRAIVGESMKMMNTVIELLAKQHQESTETKTLPSRIISDYSAWRKDINELANKVYNDSVPGTFKDRNAVLSLAYKKLQSEYGVCWDQAKRDYYNANGCMNKDTLELEYFIEQSNPNCKNMLRAKLNTIYKETCAAKSPEHKIE